MITHEEERIRKEIIIAVKDLVSNFAYYDRKEDEDLTQEMINDAFNSKLVSIKEISKLFKKELKIIFKKT